MRLGFAPPRGPFDWRVAAAGSDRARLLLHRATMAPLTALRLRGGPRLARQLQSLVGEYAQPLVAEAAPDIRVSFRGFDRYWMSIFFRRDVYEPELYHLLRRLPQPQQWDFLDGGANVGLWSAVLTSRDFGVRRAVAVEASGPTYAHLARTAALCGERFVALHCALGASEGTATFDEGPAPESRHLVLDGAPVAGARTASIRCTTVDALVRAHALNAGSLLVKLDVEGAEIACFDGAREALAAGAVFLYEDHGKDRASAVTGALLARGVPCWFLREDGSLQSIRDAAEATAQKPDVTRGYNFLAAADADVEQRLFGRR